MRKNVSVMSLTFRKNGNSEVLAKEFVKDTKEAGNSVEFITLQDKEIKFYKRCLACQKLGACVIKDYSNEIVKKMEKADVIAFASPIYYYEMSGQLKTLSDRANALFSLDYKFRDIYFLSTTADDSSHAADITTQDIQGWITCFAKAQLKGTILGIVVEAVRDIQNNLAMLKAYKMGKGV